MAPPNMKQPVSIWDAIWHDKIAKLRNDFWTEITRDNLPRRIFKCVLATIITVIIMLIPNITSVYGKAGYLACITSVFGR
ncbi:hypothetical protein BZA77DRAFT_2422 [Pyronema omphalodes]|nr:hypothetical protein BZA77DRAFT_2422 [Pyronema omphalodes]